VLEGPGKKRIGGGGGGGGWGGCGRGEGTLSTKGGGGSRYIISRLKKASLFRMAAKRKGGKEKGPRQNRCKEESQDEMYTKFSKTINQTEPSGAVQKGGTVPKSSHKRRVRV